MKIVIIGGVAGGASAATRARRLSENASIIMFDRGEFVSFANCGLPYHIGGVIPSRSSLILKTPEDFKSRFQIDVRVRHEVLSINKEAKTVSVKNLSTGEVYTEQWDCLLISTGASPIMPAIPGLDLPGVFALRNLQDMDKIQGWILTNKVTHATVVGGGFIGLEVMEALKERGLNVTLLEMSGQVMAPVDPEMASAVHDEIRRNGIDLRLRTGLESISRVRGSLVAHLSSGETISTGIIIMAIGVRPENSLAVSAGIALGPEGGIQVDEEMRTSEPGVYAVGDVVETPELITRNSKLVPLAGPANRQGRIAADNMLGRRSSYRGSQGTAICKVFSLNIGSLGLNEKQLKSHKGRVEKIYIHTANHASYYPGASMLSLKLLFDPDNGKILGAQAYGQKGVDKRIDVLSVAQRAGLRVTDLEHLELSYAPPFNSARDVINQAGMVATNVIIGDTEICHAGDIQELNGERYCIIDIRNPVEQSKFGKLPGALSIPLDSLRSNLQNIPVDKEVIIVCQSGLRGHVAYRILKANGYKTRNLSGGFITWRAAAQAKYWID
ncbi:FAD-dependent oxidoreductase [Citrobacter sp. BNK-42]|uniref:FAD-dependent oxidoreductase n=1 Tax=Citrobacter sp. BNK-42 TaxID=3376175 RepID=UPI003B502FDA